MLTLEEVKLKPITMGYLLDPNTLETMMSSMDGMQKAFGVTDEVLKVYYEAAIEILQQKRWKDARDAFLFLTNLNSKIYNFWLGLGIAEQSMENYESAIVAYSMAELMAPHKPEPLANIYQCLLAMNFKEEAKSFLQGALENCGDLEEYKELKQKLISLSSQQGE